MSEIKIIGHRGNQGFSVENSAAAILDCSSNSAIDGTELDIRITRDNEIAVIHNPIIRNINGINTRVQDLTLAEIEKLKFQTSNVDQLLQKLYTFYYQDKYFYNQYCKLGKQTSRIPTFESIMDCFDGEKHMLIELKGLPGEYSWKKQLYFEDYLVSILQEYDYQNRNIALEGYNLDALYRIKNQLPDLKTVALINKNDRLESYHMCFDGVSLEYPLITYDVINEAIYNELDLYSWDDKKPIEHYKKIKESLNYLKYVASMTVISDFPEKAREYIKK